SNKTTEEWLQELASAGVPASRVRNVAESLASEQVEALGIIQEVENEDYGRYRVLGSPVRFDHIHLDSPRPSPILGEATHELLVELGYGEADIVTLKESGAIA
ncbi:MAG: CoA transferase, partial [Acidimicrobiales bacterium]